MSKKEVISILSEKLDIFNYIDVMVYISDLERKNEELKKLCDEYEKEHNTTFREWVYDIKRFNKEHDKFDEYMSIMEDTINKLNEVSQSE